MEKEIVIDNSGKHSASNAEDNEYIDFLVELAKFAGIAKGKPIK